jgi:serine/threonine protein kinase
MKIPSDLRWKATGSTLGQGGQATVVAVEDAQNEFEGTYALKGLSSGKPRQAYERFSREVDAIKSIDHLGIIRIVDHSDSSAAFHFYVMEFHEGAKPLSKLIGTDSNPYLKNPLASLALLADLLSAVGACEQVGVVHRDLSPANILVLPDRSIKIIDFGVCQVDETETITLIDEGVGTLNYMAPECESGTTQEITSRADIYSAGKILWSAITNMKAFSREAPVFNQKSMKAIFPDDPMTWHLHNVFEKAIRHEPGARWKCAADALQDVRQIRYLVMSRYPPLELLAERCPLCGVGELTRFHQSHAVFGNPNPRGISAVQCNYCGFCFARNVALVKDLIDKRSELQ